MMLFTCLINFIESFLFTYFISKYFELNKPKTYCLLFTTIQFCLLGYANYINNSGMWLTATVVGLMILSLIVWNRTIKFDYFYITLLYNTMIIIASYIAASSTNFLISLIPSLANSFYYIACVLAKGIQALFTFSTIKHKSQISTSFTLKDWGSVVSTDALVLIALSIVVYSLITSQLSEGIMIMLLGVLFLLSFSSRIMIHKVDQLNKEKIDFVKTTELAKFNQQKLEMMNHVKNEIAATDHRLFYILIQIEQYVRDEEYDKLKEAVVRYRDLLSKYKMVIDTNNVVFDCLYSLKINELILKDINVENSIFINQNDLYNNISFINFITGLFDYFMNCSQLYVSMNEIGDQLLIKMIYRDGGINKQALKHYCDNNLSSEDTFSLENHETKGLRISYKISRT